MKKAGPGARGGDPRQAARACLVLPRRLRRPRHAVRLTQRSSSLAIRIRPESRSRVDSLVATVPEDVDAARTAGRRRAAHGDSAGQAVLDPDHLAGARPEL